MIHLDTSALIGALTGRRSDAPTLRAFVSDGLRLGMSTPVLYEWLRGPRHDDELAAEALLIPRQAVFPFGLTEATLASDLYRQMKRPRRREIDIAIAACAIANDAALWTLNRDDYADIPGLTLVG